MVRAKIREGRITGRIEEKGEEGEGKGREGKRE